MGERLEGGWVTTYNIKLGTGFCYHRSLDLVTEDRHRQLKPPLSLESWRNLKRWKRPNPKAHKTTREGGIAEKSFLKLNFRSILLRRAGVGGRSFLYLRWGFQVGGRSLWGLVGNVWGRLGAVGTALEGYFKIDKRKLEFVKLNVVYTVCVLLMITIYNY